MNEQPENFDDLLRQRFGDYQKDPPEGVWDKIHAGLNQTERRPAVAAGRRWIAIPVAASVLLVLSGMIAGISYYRHSTVVPVAQRFDLPKTSGYRMAGSNENQPDQRFTGTVPQVHQVAVPRQTPSTHLPVTVLQDQQPVEHPGMDLQNSDEAFGLADDLASVSLPNQPGQQTPSGLSSGRTFSSISLLPTKKTNELTTSQCNNITPIYSEQTESAARKFNAMRHPEFFAGLNYTPTCQLQNLKSDWIQGLSLAAGVKLSHLIVESGAGVEFQHANAVSKLSYLTDEWTGDTLTSLYHIENVEVVTRYTCLNVPVLLGYSWNVRNWAFNLKAGGIYSTQLAVNKKEIVPEHENAYNIRLFDRTPDRKTQWLSLTMVPEAEVYFNEHFSLNAAPWFRYSLMGNTNSEKIKIGNPYAFGLNIGAKFHL